MMHDLARGVEYQKGSRFGRAVEYSSGRAIRFNAVITLCVRMAMRHQTDSPRNDHTATPRRKFILQNHGWLRSNPLSPGAHSSRRLAPHQHQNKTKTPELVLLIS
jgi:hypothetical protein